MTKLPDSIFQKWIHSYEEDTGNVTIYRPAGYTFPPSRGRAGIELKPDGTFIDWAIGSADKQRPIVGQWQVEDSERVNVSFERCKGRKFVILTCDTQILKLVLTH